MVWTILEMIICTVNPHVEKQLALTCCGHFLSDEHYMDGHVTTDWILFYCIAGQGTCTCADRTIPVSPGDLVALPPSIWHRYACDPERGWDIWWMHCRGSLVQELLEIAGYSTTRVSQEIGVSGALIMQWAQLYKEARAHPLDVPLDGMANLLRLLVDIIKVRRSQYISNPWFLNQLDYTVNSIEEAAERCGCSKYHFAHRFKEMYGMPPWQYIQLLKIERAKEILLAHDIAIAQVAQMVGIPDTSYFIRLFKQKTSDTPLKFRQRHKISKLLRSHSALSANE